MRLRPPPQLRPRPLNLFGRDRVFGQPKCMEVTLFAEISAERTPVTINSEGLRRRGFDTDEIGELRRAFKIIYRQGLTLDAALERLQGMVAETPSIQVLIDSLKHSQRGIVR